ncbi:MAG: lysophospholipase [Defluviitaleaceae bacterium]|nr:lysophospholipase [Defluviitaleaceae bacterium]
MKKRIISICLAFLLIFAGQSTVFAAEYSITIGSYKLYGRLIVPQNTENPPVVIFIHGSGQWNYNSAFGGMAMFYDMAHGLAEHGIASIRFNKRHYQHSPLPSDITIFGETIDDVYYAIDFALAHEGLSEIFLVGFSNGGIVAPHIAYARPEVAGIISLAGSPRGFFEIVVSQSDFLRATGVASGLVIPSFISIEGLLRQIMALDEAAMPDTFETFNNIAIHFGFPISFLRSMDSLSIADIIDYVQIPFLILQGEEDLQIYTDQDFVAWQELLHDREGITLILYEGLNHFFAPHVPELGFSQSRARAWVDKQVIEDMAKWVLGVTQ